MMGYKRVLFVVHRNQIAKQARESFKGQLILKEAEAAKWLTRNQMDSVTWLSADITLVDKIKQAMTLKIAGQ